MDRQRRLLRKKAVRAKITGTNERPRLNVFRSSKHIYASLVDDGVGKVLLSSSDKEIKTKTNEKLAKKGKAFLLGKAIAQKAIKKGFEKVVFDRAGYLYHGRVKELAQGAREAGLKF
ncbi:MAG: 50S ribosomal protein L18 [bacterium]|nr:50S ribosomal protein L18 [bacterium]